MIRARLIGFIGCVAITVVACVWLSACTTATAFYCDTDDSLCAKNTLGLTHCDTTAHICRPPSIAHEDLGGSDFGGDDLPDGASNDLATLDLTPAGPRCFSSLECSGNTAPVCNANGQCDKCQSADDDALCLQKGGDSRRCQFAAGASNFGQCVACRATVANTQSADCTGATQPICSGNGACGACTTNAQCDSQICDHGDGGMVGRCVPASEIIYVDNRGKLVSDCQSTLGDINQKGTSDMPYCDIQKVFAATAMRNVLWVKIAGHLGFRYSRVDLTGITHKTVVLVGPGAGATDPATIYDNAAANTINVNTPGITLVLDGVEVGDRALTTAGNGIDVPAGKALTIRDAVVQHTTGSGVQAAQGTLSLLRAQVHHLGAAGVTTAQPGFVMEQSSVVTSVGIGVTITGNNALIDRSLVHANRGGGISTVGGNGQIINSLVRGNGNNNSGAGPLSTVGGIMTTGTLAVINSTIDSNMCLGGGCAASGVFLTTGGTLTLFNSVVFSNATTGTSGHEWSAANARASAYVFFGDASDTNPATNLNLATCTTDDLFVDFISDNLKPAVGKTGCTLIDAGMASITGATTLNAPNTDYDGNIRPKPGTAPDIGAYESQ